ncbi:MAG: hypothetical protein NTV89_08850 [Proteobacteria bacterium]|nr:hypothetical protein [Pseudomonadota bacterium]
MIRLNTFYRPDIPVIITAPAIVMDDPRKTRALCAVDAMVNAAVFIDGCFTGAWQLLIRRSSALQPGYL